MLANDKSATLSAVLLAGGKSRRMGRDKALLTLPGSPEFLWQRQVRTLGALKPEAIFWSGPIRSGLPKEIQIIPDQVTEAGPLAGISACLEAAATDLLLVLAIDLPEMDPTYLRGLVALANSTRGVVPQRGDFFEPLAAIYPRTASPLAREFLLAGRHMMQDFVREALRRNLVDRVAVNASDEARFKNLNFPKDLEK